jgi:NADH-quinone oxidoreductase subunit A
MFSRGAQTDMLEPYVPIAILTLFVIANAILMLGVSHLFSSYRRTPVKVAAYESGMPALTDARERFSVKFYLVAMMFIIFDIEVVFMIPWAVAFHHLPGIGGTLMLAMFVFIIILDIGFFYIWKRGALQWD